eukprot:Plantae.Rhodophyta-Purpureofilum_apyrenoidigerum.ctg6092.p1 GENE.Plantae.Rhodophyta-Purpureofilum_apyrenoidigerum.ctg6092~~Plantae.Rhodophyta-Purpureofilum_apyrenoidigerum.ctg6092.p1  ORF type:complete len:344 (+),score=52.03 Plantae.Rhodophyta-Purpureofilum_apyrenoidigerum.ctg6092:117-1034(+)
MEVKRMTRGEEKSHQSSVGFVPTIVHLRVRRPLLQDLELRGFEETKRKLRKGRPIVGVRTNAQLSSMLMGALLNSAVGMARSNSTELKEVDVGKIKDRMLARRVQDTGTSLLILVNLAVYTLAHVFNLKEMAVLTIKNSSSYKWWQLVSSLFYHSNWHQLAANLFLILSFGRLIEEEEGSAAVVLMYVVCGVLSNLTTIMIAAGHGAVSIGSGGAIFGLFAVSLLLRFRFSWKRIIETLVVGNFVASKASSEMTAFGANIPYRRLKNVNIALACLAGHAGHLAGAVSGVVVALIFRFVLRKRMLR